MAKNEAQKDTQTEQPKPVIADENTMTIYGVTIAEIISQNAGEIERLGKESKDRDAIIAAKDVEIAGLTAALETANREKVAGETLIGVLRPYRTLTTLADGSIRLPVTIPVDAATPLLSWAHDAKEDPQEYVEKILSEAMLAYCNS